MISSDDWLDAALAAYLALNTRIANASTRKQYELALKCFTASLGRRPQVDDLCDDGVAMMMSRLTARGLSPRTVNDRRSRIHAFWSWLCRRGVLRQWPTTPPLVEPIRQPAAWSETQMRQLFAAAALQRRKIGGVPAWLWWTCLLSLAWDTGARIGELMQLDWAHVDFDGRWLNVPAELRKGKRADKSYRLSPETIAYLRLLAKHDQPLLLPWDKHPSYLWEAFGRILKEAGLPTDRRSKFHRLRRSTATHFRAAGGDARKALGHTSEAVTERYIDERLLKQVHPADVLFRPDGPRPAA